MTTLKNHTYSFLVVIVLLSIIFIYLRQYGWIIAIALNTPFLDPDNDQFGKGKLHRWWYSHSIFPALIITVAFINIIPNHLLFYAFIGFSLYSIIHLWGDLASDEGLARIKLYPLKKSINNRLWILMQTILFLIIGGLLI
jgi:hypothetical protein